MVLPVPASMARREAKGLSVLRTDTATGGEHVKSLKGDLGAALSIIHQLGGDEPRFIAAARSVTGILDLRRYRVENPTRIAKEPYTVRKRLLGCVSTIMAASVPGRDPKRLEDAETEMLAVVESVAPEQRKAG